MPKDDIQRLKIDKSVKKSVRAGRKMKPFVIGSFVLLIALAAVLYRTGVIAPTATVDVTTVSLIYPAQSLSVLNASGYVVAQRKAAVASKMTGRLIALTVEEGNVVKKGQILARMENEDVSAVRDQAGASLANARAMLAQVTAERDFLQQEYDRYQRLISDGYVSQSDFEMIATRYMRSREAVKAAQAAVEGARAALSGAEINMEYALIRAPFDGVVLTKNADVGDIVTPLSASAASKAAVVTLADMDSLQVEVDVSETSITLIRTGQPCDIQFDALSGQRFRGVVHAIVPTVDRAKATVLVKVRLLDRDERLLPEMSAKVSFLPRELTEEEFTPRVAVSRAALISRGEKSMVYRVENNRARETVIVPGKELNDMIEVQAGVETGDRVVLHPGGMKDGTRIRIAER